MARSRSGQGLAGRDGAGLGLPIALSDVLAWIALTAVTANLTTAMLRRGR